MTGHTTWRDSSTCPVCGKQRFNTRKDAKHAAHAFHPGAHLSVYRCGDWWHYGNLPDQVIEGDVDRHDLPISDKRLRP